MLNVNRAELLKRVCEQTDISEADIKHILEVMLVAITDTLASNNDVLLSGFGKFVVTHKNARPGRNPKTGEIKTVLARRSINLKFSDTIKKQVQQNSTQYTLKTGSRVFSNA